MKPKLILGLALVLSGGLLGCSTNQRLRNVNCHPSISDAATESSPNLPVRFAGYREFYAFVAQRTYGGMPTNTDTLFKLAADSTTEIITLERLEDINLPPYVYIVTSHYYNGGIFDQIRGVQGNGDYYILRLLAKDFTSMDTDHGFELVGIVEGNVYRWEEVAKHLILKTHWHGGAWNGEDGWISYKWNGKFFEQIK